MPDKPPLTLATPIQYAKGVGPSRAPELVSLSILTCGDLLFHYPRNYLRYTDEAPISHITPGDVATVRGTLLQTRLIRKKPRRFEALLDDGSNAGPDGKGDGHAEAPGRCTLTWFNAFGLEHKLQPGMLVRVTGKVTLFRNRPQITQPQYEILNEDDPATKALKAARIEPVYPATANLSTQQIARLVAAHLDLLIPQISEYFPPEFLKERNFLTRREALCLIHQPQTLNDTITARRTLAYHEFFLHQSAVALKRYHQRNSSQAMPLRVDDAVDARIRALLPFELTGAQNRVIETLRKDLTSTKPMNRLLQGDVGSGKTVVALYAMLAATATRRSDEGKALRTESQDSNFKSPPTQSSALSTHHFAGHQAALMAPTEILAEQHFITLTKLLEGKKVKIALLTGSVTGRERETILRELADGSLALVVGTHALLSESVQFRALALVVIDEQHKFGVEQRSLIRTKPSATGTTPHILVMTATPIPRTLAMTAFGDLDVSVIDELPPGRQPIFTKMTATSSRDELYEWLAKKLAQKEQAYIVLPAIDDGIPDPEFEAAPPPADPAEAAPIVQDGASADGGASIKTQNSKLKTPPQPSVLSTQPLRSAVTTQRELQTGPLKDFRVGLIHGRMNRETRQHIMERFREGLIDALVATTVIEVGVDVANASIMIIEHADRFGLSQLHQLRGRVGRGNRQSYCILLADQSTDDSIARIQAMIKHTSGFKIAEEDLRLRGMGHLIGTAQSGRTDLHFADLLFDPHLLPMSRRDAFNMIAADPRLLDPVHKELRTIILARFADTITLVDVG